MRRHRRAFPGNGNYRRTGNARTGEALAWLRQAKHWRSRAVPSIGIAEWCSGLVGQCAGIALTSIAAASKRQAKAQLGRCNTAQRRHRTDQLGYGTGMRCSARASGRRATQRQSLTRPRQKHSIESQGHSPETRWHSHDMQGRSKALGTNAGAKSGKST